MGIALEMKQLTGDITASRLERSERLGEIRKETSQIRTGARELLDGLQASRGQAGLRLNKDLTDHEARRKSEAMNILKEARDILSSFAASRQQSSVQLRKDLANSVSARKIQAGEASRKLTQAFRDSRRETAPRLRQELSQNRSSIKTKVAELLSDARDLITDFHKHALEAGVMVRNNLDKSRTEREAAVKEMRGTFQALQTAARDEINKSRDAWQELNGNKPAKRTRKARTPAKPAEEVSAGNKSPGLGAKLLEAISQHPQGITLTEVADNLSVASIVLGRVTRKLLDEGKIRKEDRTYFPAIGE
ncbi:MAG: hypothetical protein HY662_01350 [Chloroflexi bacterium]|nr:hypothetical protein [Chloroflexota bacterium]